MVGWLVGRLVGWSVGLVGWFAILRELGVCLDSEGIGSVVCGCVSRGYTDTSSSRFAFNASSTRVHKSGAWGGGMKTNKNIYKQLHGQ